MALCPNCGAQIETDFGMVLCPACSSAIFFDMDGNPHLGKHEADQAQMQETVIQPNYEAPTVQEPEIFMPAEEQSYSIPESNFEPNGPSSEGTQSNLVSEFATENLQQNEVLDQVVEPQFEVVENQVVFEDSQNATQPEVDFEQTLDQSMQQVESAAAEEGQGNFKEEIVEFGNSVSVGELTYNLTVSGLDTGDLKKRFSEVISDPKFALNVAELKGQIRNGVLIIENLNSVKTSVLVNKLKSLPVEIKWSQNAQ